MRFGPDLSNYQSQFSAEDAQKLVDKQCSFAIIGRQKNNSWATQQRNYLRQVGITTIAEYLISLRGEWPVLFPETKYVAVDVEPGSEFTSEENIDGAVAWIQSQGRIPLIYSARWAWDTCGLTMVTKYAEQGIGLWDANYDGVTDGYVLPTPFGGWTKCVIDQYTADWNDGELGYPIDMNNCEDDFFGPMQAPSADNSTAIKAELEAIKQAVAHIEGLL